MKVLVLTSFFALLALNNAFSQPVSKAEAGDAQGAMVLGYRSRVAAYEAHLRPPQIFSDYCQIELNEAHNTHAIDGSIPFGINYNNVDRNTLHLTIKERGAYEEAFLKLCLAKVETTLRDAEY